ncbi:MAG: bifunctional oligoribonuclease/PAP phosphatase NrnA [Acidobacteria bacterium]|uniref:Bifunctional oligoribonuclease/PAP phosphatase NrnA n=1 Tax=Candidatus Sulfomarinibacter kjeldsenii TaxID=2885994 RepID=A0A8J7CE64_9BACT|nr:bifunctional oligoribonuclease/PAP phosphatase NrnA [Candidatus Sulfomarinibacter kjeldsenii]MBD3857147.1 bifunctional oligoribonuclease/PAP phosphatase NrnA [Candidatus Sulfomarinibacter kjeldsenii]MBD3869867.1 bifunctional oligoribonuclease/PAP phosphatase NrnA [Candidatus Sulfomarinibacter kjeldsenii]
MTTTSTDPHDAAIKLSEAYRILLTCHRNPDGDAIGSELAIAELAEKSGVKAVIVNRDETPANLRMLPGADRVVVSNELPEDFPEKYDLVVTVECPQIERSGFEGLTQLPILNIDHHPDNPAYGVVNYLDDQSPAVGEMVWRLFGEVGVLPSPEAATNMFTALSTDTGDFRYSNATGRAFRAAAEMVDAGAQPPQVANWVHNNRSLASVRLLGESLRTLRIVCDGRLALITADQEAFQRAEAGPEDTEETVNIPRSIAGVEAVVYFKQWEPEVVRISLRARGSVDVRKVAASFGGGGHPNAAGCTVKGKLTEVEEMVAAAVAEALGGSV